MKEKTWRQIVVLTLLALFAMNVSLYAYYSTKVSDLEAQFTQLEFRINHLDLVATCQFHQENIYYFNVPSAKNAIWGEATGLPYLPVGSAIQISVQILSNRTVSGTLVLSVSPTNPTYIIDQHGNVLPSPPKVLDTIHLPTVTEFTFTVPSQGDYAIQVNNTGNSTLIVQVTVGPPPYC
jgi:hypothetical protein